MRREIVAGLRLATGNPILRAIGVQKVAGGISDGVFGTLIVLYAIKTLGFGPGVFGTIAAIGGASAISGL